ncbi:Chloramphenicol acetyltransferase-like domain-containing protein [Artemisia annua]|uniref:Chloramphenicol acetyltransferase-like domain-containing protein n=1 Tax=Artemisia annua TaxID=35608 RepID=A0A2U1PJ91_ARTAN|nr:Chloramphenicol acetyltransferase-like domain-containing protein [Artemisia annua]
MGIDEGKSFSVKVVDNVVVHAHEPCNNHWLPFTNLDLLVAPFDVGSFFCYKKPSHGSFSTIINTLKASLSRALSLYYPLAGEILWNVDARENQIHCNNRGVDFTEAVADVQLKQLNLYNPDESIEGKLIPKKLHGVLAIQVTELKCGGMVIGCMFDHRAADGYSANMFISSWADITRSGSPSMLPSFNRSFFNPRFPTTYSSSIDDVFAIFEPPTKPDHDQNHENDDLLINRVYYIEGKQLGRVQSLAIENERRRSKELKGMSLSQIATEVHEFLQIATTKEHFVDLIDWVEERRSQPLVARAFASRDMSVMISSGQRFQIMDKMDFGWGKVAFGSCHVPSSRKDCYVMTLPSPTKNEDWVVYMHMPMKIMNYIEKHANHMFKPMNTEYLQI